MKTSNLNPLACSFVPLKVQVSSEMVSLGKISFKSIANRYLQDLIENKKKKNENAVTREEISIIVMKLMEYGDKKSQKYDPFVLKRYLKSKVPEALSIKPLVAPKVKVEEKKPPSSDGKAKGFDLSVFQAPKENILLVSLWGLHRQEQALRPMISMTHRPESLEDRVWSVTPRDLTVWNPHAVEKPCRCPPMFGYSVPPFLFGNPLNVSFACDIATPHLNRYQETPDGDELALVPSERVMVLGSDDVFKDPEDGDCKERNLDSYLQEFKMIVNNVCKLIGDDKDKDGQFIFPDLDSKSDMKNLWDLDITENRPKAESVVEDDNCHPLLDYFDAMEETIENEGVANHIKEMIRRSFSSETTDSGISEDCCNPPCSQWCQSSPKCTDRAREALVILNDTTDYLLNFDSPESHLREAAPTQRPNFKRSFSANDCDAYLENMKSKEQDTKGSLLLLQKDPVSFFKELKGPWDGWVDSDSGISSSCSTPDDFRDYGFEEGEETVADADLTPMWSLFSGDGSLWQPLPNPNQEECVRFTHKRVKELRRMQSMT